MTELKQQELIPLCTGERLKQERVKRGLALSEVAVQLHIDLPVLTSIEQDQLQHLASVYQRGYISSYARFLKFEESEIEQMLSSIGMDHPEILTVFPEAGNPNQADRWLKAASYVLASLLVGTLAWQFTHEAVRLSQKGTQNIAANKGQSDSQNRQVLGSSTRQIEGATHVNASIAALEILRNQKEARQTGGNVAWDALELPPAKIDLVESAAVTDAGQALSDGEYTLKLITSGDSWVEITDANGARLEVDLVRAGTDKEYRGFAPFKIQIGNPRAISLFVDGKAVDLMPFTQNGVIQMTLDAEVLSSSAIEKDPNQG